MFAKALTTALVSATLLTGAFQTSAFASGCGGGEGGGAASITHIHKKLPSASATDRRTGVTTTSRGNVDGSRTITVTDRDGRVLRTERVEGKKKAEKKADKKKDKKVAKKPGRSWASAYDRDTGTRTTSIGNGDGTRTVISIGPFGLSVGLSR